MLTVESVSGFAEVIADTIAAVVAAAGGAAAVAVGSAAEEVSSDLGRPRCTRKRTAPSNIFGPPSH